MMKKLISIDLVPMEYRAKDLGFPYMPIKEIIEFCSQQGAVDIIETLVPLIRRVPSDETDESVSKVTQAFNKKQFALQMSGARVIECPSKISSSSASGYKQSDDQRLMLTTLMLAMKLRPRYLMLFAADGDFAPLVEVLRGEGIRTEIVAPLDTLASELKRHATRVIDYDAMLREIRQRYWNGPLARTGHSEEEGEPDAPDEA